MAKEPEIAAITNVYTDKAKINENFENIRASFLRSLSRDGSTPNSMQVDYDIADANITNTNIYTGEQVLINGLNVLSYQELLMYHINELTFGTGGMIYAPEDDTVGVLAIGDTVQALKSSGVIPVWGADNDTDTVGVTVQEDGVTVLENVTTIDFTWDGSVLVSSPGAGQVDLAMNDLLSALWEDNTQDDTNINPDGPSESVFNDVNEVVRLDLLATVGLSAVPVSNNLYYVIMETSSWLETSNEAGSHPQANGTWGHAVRFYDDTGTSTPLTGNLIGAPGGEVASRLTTTVGGALQTVYCGIPADTKYIDFGKADAFLFPLFIDHATIDNRYRAVVTAAQIGIVSPNGIAYPGGVNTTVTPDPSP